MLIQHLVKPLPSLVLRLVLPWFKYKRSLKKIRIQIENLYAKTCVNNSDDSEKKDPKNDTKSESKSNSQVDESQKITSKNFNEKVIEIYLKIERSKGDATELIDDEYHDKTALYGYMIIFGCAFSLSPFLILVIFLLTLRLSSKGFLMYHRRTIGHKAQNVGIWIWVCRFLNVVGIANLSFYTALNSTWSKSKSSIIANNYTYRYIFIIVFEVSY